MADVDRRAFNWDSVPIKTGATADPAAGADPAAITVPTGKKWLFLGGSGVLVTDGTAANRYPRLNIRRDGTNDDSAFQVAVAHTASQTVTWTFAPGVPPTTTLLSKSVVGIPANGIEVPAGGIIYILTAGLVAGDNWGVFYYAYKEVPV